jgi:PAS domain S-box-containing protein
VPATQQRGFRVRTNLPVTNVEYQLADDCLIVSKTDTKGRITYFNQAFVDASGFSAEEMMGQPHNIVRHPDMPAEAFQNMWDTLNAGRPWYGAVKNRRKNGDHYWVMASASPIWENGAVAGYMSIRSKLPADLKAEAEQVYAQIRAKQCKNYIVADGIIRRLTMFDRLSFFTGTLKARLTTLVIVLVTFMMLVGITGMVATQGSNAAVKTIYEDRTVTLAQLFAINDLLKDDAITLYQAGNRGKAGQPIGDVAGRIGTNAATINKTWADYMATYLTPEEAGVAASFAPKLKDYLDKTIQPGQALLADRKYDELTVWLGGPADALWLAAKADLDRLVDIQVKEAKANYDSAQSNYVAALAIVAGLLCAGLLYGGWLGLRTIQATLRPLGRLKAAMDNIAHGDLTSRILIKRDDEIGTALRNIQAMQAKLAFDREVQIETERRITAERRSEMHNIAENFENVIGEVIDTVSAASTELEQSAGGLTTTAERAERLSGIVAHASTEATTNVQSVASATEAMTTSVNEIKRQVQDSAKIANDAVDQARLTNERVSELSSAATRIGAVVELINNIAGQTNLLALNATIEAARAGEAGRGFAVVASEVKALAEQTAKATGEIGQQITGIQTATQESVTAIKAIGDTIGRLSEISSTIAAAVDQQGAATQEITRSVQQASHATEQVSSHIGDVENGARETGTASTQLYGAAQSLSRESAHLKHEVAKFLDSVRAA